MKKQHALIGFGVFVLGYLSSYLQPASRLNTICNDHLPNREWSSRNDEPVLKETLPSLKNERTSRIVEPVIRTETRTVNNARFTVQPVVEKTSHKKSTSAIGYVRIGDFDIQDNTTQFNRGQNVTSLYDAQMSLAKIVAIPTEKCNANERWGLGGYGLCFDGRLKPNPKDCLIYGFGIGKSWSFEDKSNGYGCEVHSFDPSIGMDDHERSPGHFFHNIGLWGSDKVHEETGWQLKSIDTIVNELGHKRRVFDAIKMDIENSEWSFLHTFVRTNIPRRVKQLIFEIHSPIRRGQKLTIDTIRIMYNDLTSLMDSFGFQLIKSSPVSRCCGPRFGTLTPAGMLNMTDNICCYEMCFINKKFK